MQQALTSAINNAPIWFATPPQERAAILERAAVLMESQMPTLMGIPVREAGKTFSNAIAEVRRSRRLPALLCRPGARRFR
ncbi:aldehyde dehydrogenase family protein [Klebsiella variicola subsp. variicola]|nr:aldehyde dehydrogenase family protein [Klebsiella variicola subsp. variicola]